jgi:hypothetical protein
MSHVGRIAGAFLGTGLLIALACPVATATDRVPTIAFTVKVLSPTSRLVHIVDRDTVPGYFFLIRAVDSPRIVAAKAPNGPCMISQGSFFVLTERHNEYRAHCRFTLAPGKAFDVRLTTHGRGNVAAVACPRKPASGPCAF